MVKGKKPRLKEKEVVHSNIAHYLLPDARLHPCTPISPLSRKPPSLYTGHDILWCGIFLWPVQITCPSCVLSSLFVHFLTGRA